MNKARFIFVFITSTLVITGYGNRAMAQVDMLEPTSAMYYYSGTIGNTQHIEFNLQLKGRSASGSYIVESNGDMFIFSGRLDTQLKGIGVLVYNSDNNYVASIEANFVSEGGNFGKQLNGKVKSANGRVVKDIKLVKVAEFAANATETPMVGSAMGE